jgi:hypothetical protein
MLKNNLYRFTQNYDYIVLRELSEYEIYEYILNK